jgi:hypothetical protein
MMIKRQLASISGLDPIEVALGAIAESLGTANESSNHLRAPTVDERAALYLRAVHEKHDFTSEEHSRARDLILDAMAADVIANSKASLPEELAFPNRSKNANEVGTVPFANLDDSSLPTLARQKIVSLAYAYVTRSAGNAAASSASQAAPRGSPSLARRKVSIFGAAAIAAVMAFFLVTVFPTSWFDTNPNSPEFQVAVRSLPLRAPKQVETTVAPPGERRAISNSDTLIRRAETTNQIDTEDMTDLLNQGRRLIAAGDIPAARSVLKRAAEAGDASAALELGATYDPFVLNQYSGATIAPDIAKARAWYLTARELGSAEASKQLERLERADR